MFNDKLERAIAKFLNGDKTAFAYIYENTHNAVYFAALYVVKRKHEAEDIVQETYLKAVTNLSSYKTGTNFTAWLCKIAKNAALNYVKKHSREQLTDFEADSYKYGTYQTELPYIFDIAQKYLSEDEYEILMLCQVAGYKRREVSAMLGMPIGTVTWKNNEALKKLKKIIKEEGI